MKRVIYKGLLALTIAFGVTSCDKNEMDDIAAPTVGVVANDDYSKVSFKETGVSIAPVKGAKSDVASKNASEFGALGHFYGSGPQDLIIRDAAGEQVYEGAYTPNEISSLEPASIILVNGTYNISTSNSADQSGLVLGFLPYTSSASVNLAESQSVTLQASLLRGFVIVDAASDLTEGGNRIQSVTLSQPAAGDIAAKSGNLISDTREGANDFYGYLKAGEYAVSIAYTRNSVDGIATGNVTVVNGVATTLDPILLGDVAPEPVITYRVATAVVTSTELIEGNQNGDTDTHDLLSRTDTTTFTITDTVEDPNGETVEGEWIVTDRDSLTINEGDNTPGDSSDPVYVAREYSVYAPAFGTQIANFTQTREVTNTDGSFDPDVAAVLSQEVIVSSTGGVESTENSDEATLGRSINSDEDELDTITRQVTSDEVYTASVAGTHTVVTPNGSWSIVVDNDAVIADTPDSGAWAVNADGTAAIFVITQGGNALDTDAPVAQAAPDASLLTEGKQYVAGDDFVDGSVAIEDIPVVANVWAENGGVYTHADYAGYSFTIIEDLFSTSGSVAEVSNGGTFDSYQGSTAATIADVIIAAKAYVETK